MERQATHDTTRVLETILLKEAKTGTGISILEHSSHVLQVAMWLLRPLDLTDSERTVLSVAAALHDMGKAVTDPKRGQWRHAKESAALVPAILSDPTMRDALREAGLDLNLSEEQVEEVARLCHEHHGMSGATLLNTVGATVLIVADILASCLEGGWAGPIGGILSHGLSNMVLTSLKAQRRAPWLDTEIHSVEFPKDSPADALFSEHLLDRFLQRCGEHGLEPVMRSEGKAWVAGPFDVLDGLLDMDFSTADALDISELPRLYESGNFPRPPKIDFPALHYFFASDKVACMAMRDLFNRRKPETRDILERHGLSFTTLTQDMPAESIQDPLVLGQTLYSGLRGFLAAHDPQGAEEMTEDVLEWAAHSCSKPTEALSAAVLERATEASPELAADFVPVWKMLRMWTMCRSLPMLVREVVSIRAELELGEVRFSVRDVAIVDESLPPSLSLERTRDHRSRACALCRERPGTEVARTMVAGSSEGDGTWAATGDRKNALFCPWCHSSALHALPMVTLRLQNGSRKIRELNYLYVETLLSRSRLARALADLGFMELPDAEEAVQPFDEETDGLSDEAAGLFNEILGYVPEKEVLLGVEGLKDSPAIRSIAARILPGSTPLASRAVFVIPSPTFFGQHSAKDMNQKALTMVAMGVVATLREHLGVARFVLRTSSARGSVHLDAESVGEDMLHRAQAGFAIAEFRRRFFATESTAQSEHEIDVGFLIELAERPREAVNRLIREVMDDWQRIPQTREKIQALVSLIDRMVPPEHDPVSRLMADTMNDLMDIGAVKQIRSPLVGGDGRLRKRSNRGMAGAFHRFWDVVDRVSLERWGQHAREVATRKIADLELRDQRSRVVNRVIRRILEFGEQEGLDLAEIKQRLCSQMYLGVLSTARTRRDPDAFEPETADILTRAEDTRVWD